MSDIQIEVRTQFLPEQSKPDDNQFVYAYTIRITNKGVEPVQLVSRHWLITDDRLREQEVKGEGVVGQQPTLAPEQSYTYTSGAVLETPSGMMAGSYTMLREDGSTFEAEIPPFALVQPGAVH